MIDAVLTLIVGGTLMSALAIDVALLLDWIQHRRKTR